MKPQDVEPIYHALMQEHLFADAESGGRILPIAPMIANVFSAKGIREEVSDRYEDLSQEI